MTADVAKLDDFRAKKVAAYREKKEVAGQWAKLKEFGK